MHIGVKLSSAGNMEQCVFIKTYTYDLSEHLTYQTFRAITVLYKHVNVVLDNQMSDTTHSKDSVNELRKTPSYTVDNHVSSNITFILYKLHFQQCTKRNTCHI